MSKTHLLNGSIAGKPGAGDDGLPLPNTCGSCEFCQALPGNGEMVLCGGVPPTPVPMGARQNIAGGTEIICQMMMPQLPKGNKGCALYRPRAVPIIGAAKGVA